MPIKETPLIKAMEHTGPLPGFLFDHPVFSGFLALIMSAVFGAFTAVFIVAGHGGVEAIELFEAARLGAILGLVVGGLTLAGIFFSAIVTPDERRHRFLFVLGGVLGIAFLATVDWFALDWLRAYFSEAGPLMCTGVAQGCR